jgi:transcriptional regulator with XRE-family HTH domain
MDKKQIGQRLKELRANSSLSVDEVLQILKNKYGIEVRPNTLYGYENGRTSPDVDLFLALCKIYSCRDILYEFGYTDIKEIYNIHNPEEKEIIEKYQKLPETGKDMIRGALGIEKRDEQKMEEIS